MAAAGKHAPTRVDDDNQRRLHEEETAVALLREAWTLDPETVSEF